MILNHPLDFDLAISGGAYKLWCDSKPAKFAAPISTRGIAKLYTVSNEDSLVYVGIAQQPMSSRLSYGLCAAGKSGYHGYKWKAHGGTLRLAVWTASDAEGYAPLRELKTVEAEVAFLCRHLSGQWPLNQHEIHFYPSNTWHREAAQRIYEHAVRHAANNSSKLTARRGLTPVLAAEVRSWPGADVC
jgi:hypothetical protein